MFGVSFKIRCFVPVYSEKVVKFVDRRCSFGFSSKILIPYSSPSFIGVDLSVISSSLKNRLSIVMRSNYSKCLCNSPSPYSEIDIKILAGVGFSHLVSMMES